MSKTQKLQSLVDSSPLVPCIVEPILFTSKFRITIEHTGNEYASGTFEELTAKIQALIDAQERKEMRERMKIWFQLGRPGTAPNQYALFDVRELERVEPVPKVRLIRSRPIKFPLPRLF